MGDFQQVLHTVIPSPPVVHTPSPPSQAPFVAPVVPSVAPPSNEPVMPTFVTPTRQTVILPARTTTTDFITTTTTTNVPPTGSILPNITYQSQGTPYYIPLSYLSSVINQDPLTVSTVNAQTINVSTLNSISTNAQNVLTNYIEATEAYVYDKLTLDNQVLTANATELLLNGSPLVTANQISSIADWSKDPAISTIRANGNDLTNVRYANFSTIVADGVTVRNLTYLYSTTIQTFESTVTAEIHKLTVSSITGGNAYFDVLTAGTFINPSASTINCDYINVSSNANIKTATFSNAPTFNQGATFNGTRPNFTTGFVTSGANNFNFQNIDNASNINGNVITIAPQNNLNVNTSNAMTVTVDRFADVGGSAVVSLTAKDGAGTLISLNANSAHPNALTPTSAVNINAQGNVGLLTDAPYGGAVNITAQAGLTGLGASVLGGGGINLTAYSYGILAPGTIKESAGSILAYSGLTTPSVGVIGNSYYSALNCLSLTAGATPATTSYPGVVYLRGDSGTKVVNGFYTDTITATGNSVLPTITGVTSINGSAYPPTSGSGVWCSTATTALNMNGNSINNISNAINFQGGGSIKDYVPSIHLFDFDGNNCDQTRILNGSANIVLLPGSGGQTYFGGADYYFQGNVHLMGHQLDMGVGDITNVDAINMKSGGGDINTVKNITFLGGSIGTGSNYLDIRGNGTGNYASLINGGSYYTIDTAGNNVMYSSNVAGVRANNNVYIQSDTSYVELIANGGTGNVYLTAGFTEFRGNADFTQSNSYISGLAHIYGNTSASGGGLAIDYLYFLGFNSAGNNANLYCSGGQMNMLNYNGGTYIQNFNAPGTGNLSLYSASNDVIVATGAGHNIAINSGSNIYFNSAQPNGLFAVYTSTLNAQSLLDTNLTIGQNFNVTATGSAQLRASYFNFFNDCYFNSKDLHDVKNLYRVVSGTAINQPVIQYGTDGTGSGVSGHVTVTIPTAYTSKTTYVVQVTMQDAPTAQLYATPLTSNTFEIGWTSAGTGTQNIMWTTFGT